MNHDRWRFFIVDYELRGRAEVIKIEHPARGDDTRAWGPPYAKRLDGEGPGESAYYLGVS